MTLWLIRHAKSDWNAGVASDFDRPLNDRGERDGARMARWLAGQPDPARWIWSSDAARAQATARFVAAGFAAGAPELILDHRLYLAGPERLLEVVRETPADIASVAVVAHNPGLTELVNLLAGHTVTDNVPTFGVARFDLAPPWEQVHFGAARLALLMAPKRLGDGV